MNESEPVLETRDKSMGCLAVGFALLTVVLFVTSHFDPKSKPPTLAGTVFIFLLGFGIAAYLAARAKRDYLRSSAEGLLISTVWRQVFVPYVEIEDYFLLKLTNDSGTRTVSRYYIIWRGENLLLSPFFGKKETCEAILQRIEERASNAVSQKFEVRDWEPTLLTLPATFAYQKALVTRLRAFGFCLGVAFFYAFVQWVLVQEIGWQFFDGVGRAGFFLAPLILLVSLPFWLPSALRNLWFLWRHRDQTLKVNHLGLTIRDREDVQFLAWEEIDKLEVVPVPKRLTQLSYRVSGSNKILEWHELLPGKHAELIEEQLALRSLKWEKNAAALRHFDGMWEEKGRHFFSCFNDYNRFFMRMWLAFSAISLMILGILGGNFGSWHGVLAILLFFPFNFPLLLAPFVWVWSYRTLYIYDENGLEYRGLFRRRFIGWNEAKSWNGTTLRANDGRMIVVMLALDKIIHASRNLAAKIEKHISRTK